MGLAFLAASCSLFKPKPQSVKEISLEVRTSPCFGSCAVYEMRVENGMASYIGLRYPKRNDTLTIKLPSSELDSILYIFNQNSYWDLAEIYDNPNISDLPSTRLKFREDGKEKSVLVRADIPDNLINILRYIERFRKRTFQELN